MKILLRNLSEIVQCHKDRGFIPLGCDTKLVSEYNAIAIENDKILSLLKDPNETGYERVIDCRHGIAVPGFIDSHTHLVFHGTREDEFEMRAKGRTYKDIGLNGGGIKKSVRMTREAGEEELFSESKKMLEKFILRGVTSIEIKSGYGLDKDTEIKQLKVIRRLKEEFRINIKATYLGAHEIPTEYKDDKDGYIKFMTDEMIPFIAKEKLSDYVDVFCEKGVYTGEEAERILEAGLKNGLKSRVHADEIEFSNGSTVAAKLKAKSVDHFNNPDIKDLQVLKKNNTVITLLPATNFFLHLKTKPPIDEMRRIGNIIAISTDFNPGSSPLFSILLSATIGMINYNLLPDELISAITINPAHSLDLSDRTGSIKEGKDADILVFDRENYKQLFYFVGDDIPKMVFSKGKIIYG